MVEFKKTNELIHSVLIHNMSLKSTETVYFLNQIYNLNIWRPWNYIDLGPFILCPSYPTFWHLKHSANLLWSRTDVFKTSTKELQFQHFCTGCSCSYLLRRCLVIDVYLHFDGRKVIFCNLQFVSIYLGMVLQITEKYFSYQMPSAKHSGQKIAHLYLENLHICFLIRSAKFIFGHSTKCYFRSFTFKSTFLTVSVGLSCASSPTLISDHKTLLVHYINWFYILQNGTLNNFSGCFHHLKSVFCGITFNIVK